MGNGCNNCKRGEAQEPRSNRMINLSLHLESPKDFFKQSMREKRKNTAPSPRVKGRLQEKNTVEESKKEKNNSPVGILTIENIGRYLQEDSAKNTCADEGSPMVKVTSINEDKSFDFARLANSLEAQQNKAQEKYTASIREFPFAHNKGEETKYQTKRPSLFNKAPETLKDKQDEDHLENKKTRKVSKTRLVNDKTNNNTINLKNSVYKNILKDNKPGIDHNKG